MMERHRTHRNLEAVDKVTRHLKTEVRQGESQAQDRGDSQAQDGGTARPRTGGQPGPGLRTARPRTGGTARAATRPSTLTIAT